MPATSFIRRLHARLTDRLRAGTSTARIHPDAGFALTEVLVSMIIFGIVAASASMAIFGGIGANAATQGRVAGANVAQQAVASAVATAQSLPKSSLTSANFTNSTYSPTDPTGYTVTRTVTYPNVVNGVGQCPSGVATSVNTVLISVAVTGTPLGNRTITMDTAIAC